MDTSTDNTSVVPASTSQPSESTVANKILTSESPLEYIVKANIDLVQLYKELNIIATKAMICAKDRDGDAIELGPDNKARISAIALLLELAKHIKDKGTVAQVAIINDSGIMDDARRIIAMRNKSV